MTNAGVITRLQKIRDLIDERVIDIDSDSLSLQLDTEISPTQLKQHTKKRSKSSKSKNPPPKKSKREEIKAEKTYSKNKKQSRQHSKSTSKTTHGTTPNYYSNKFENSFSDDEIDPIYTHKHYTNDTARYNRSSKSHKHSTKLHPQDKYDFDENKRGRSIRYYTENPYAVKNDSERTQSKESYTNRGYYYKAHDSDAGKDKYRKSSDKYYYVHKSKEEPQNSRRNGIYVTSSFKTSKSPQPYKSIHEEVYGYDGILNQNKKKNRKFNIFDSSSDSPHLRSSSEDELDKYMGRSVEKARRNMEKINLSSSSSDNFDIENITRKYRKPTYQETTKKSITNFLNKKDSWSLDNSDDSEFNLKMPTVTRSIPTTTTSLHNSTLRKPYLDNFSNSSSSDDLIQPYSKHLDITSKRFQPAKSIKSNILRKKYLLSSSDDNDSKYTWKNKLDSIKLSSDDDDSDVNLSIPKYSHFNKTSYTSQKHYNDTYSLKAPGKFVSPSSLNTKTTARNFLLDSDDESNNDIFNYGKFSLNQNAKLNRPISSSSDDDDDDTDIDLNPYLRRTRYFDDSEMLRNRAALKNALADFSDSSSSSSSINLDDIIIKPDLNKQTQKILDGSDSTDDLGIFKNYSKPKPNQKSNLSLSKPVFHHSPEIKDSKKPRANKKDPLDDDFDLEMKMKLLANIDGNSQKSGNKISNNMNLEFSSSDSANDFYNQYSAITDQDIQKKAKQSYQNNYDDDDKSSTDDLIRKYSNLMPNTAGKKVEIAKKENSNNKINNDEEIDSASELLQQLKNTHLLSSDDEELENFLKKNSINNNTTKTEIIADSENDLPETIINNNDKANKLNRNPSTTASKKEEEEDDNLTDILMNRYKLNKADSSDIQTQNPNDKLQQAQQEEEEEERENLDSTYDIIEDRKSMEEKIFRAFDEPKEEAETLSPSDNDIQSENLIDSKIEDIQKRLEQIEASDDESTKNKYESLHWKTSSDELPKHSIPHYFNSSGTNENEDENENAKKEKSNNIVLDFIPPEEGQDSIRIGKSPSNDIRIEDDIQYDIINHENEDEEEDDEKLNNSQPKKNSYSSLLFNFNSSSQNIKSQKQGEEEEEEEVNIDNNEQKIESPLKNRLKNNLNPLIIPTNNKSNIDSYNGEHKSGSGIATPIKSPDDVIPGTFNSDNSADDVFGLTQPSPKSITPSPFNSDAEILDNEKKKPISPSQNKKSSPHPIPLPDDIELNKRLTSIMDSIEESDSEPLFPEDETIKTSPQKQQQQNANLDLFEEEDEEESNEIIQNIDFADNNQNDNNNEEADDDLLNEADTIINQNKQIFNEEEGSQEEDEDEIEYQINQNQPEIETKPENQFEFDQEEEEDEAEIQQKNNFEVDPDFLVDQEEENQVQQQQQQHEDEEEDDDNEINQFEVDINIDDHHQQKIATEGNKFEVDPDFLIDQEEENQTNQEQESPDELHQEGETQSALKAESTPNGSQIQDFEEEETEAQLEPEVQQPNGHEIVDPNFLIDQEEDEEEEAQSVLKSESTPNGSQIQDFEEEETEAQQPDSIEVADPNFLIDQEEETPSVLKTESTPNGSQIQDFEEEETEAQLEPEVQQPNSIEVADPNFLIDQEEETPSVLKSESTPNGSQIQDFEEEETEAQQPDSIEVADPNFLIDQEEATQASQEHREFNEEEEKQNQQQDDNEIHILNIDEIEIEEDEEEEGEIDIQEINDFGVDQIEEDKNEDEGRSLNQSQQKLENQSSGFEVDMVITNQDENSEEEDSEIDVVERDLVIDDAEEDENQQPINVKERSIPVLIEDGNDESLPGNKFEVDGKGQGAVEGSLGDGNQFEVDFDDNKEEDAVEGSPGNGNQFEVDFDDNEEEEAESNIGNGNQFEVDFEDNNEEDAVEGSLGDGNQFEVDFDDEEEEENRQETPSSEEPSPAAVKKRSITITTTKTVTKTTTITENTNQDEEDSNSEIIENYDRLDELIIEPRPFVHIEGLSDEIEADKNGAAPKSSKKEVTAAAEGNAEEESDFDIQENYDRLGEIVVEPRPFVHIEGLSDEIETSKNGAAPKSSEKEVVGAASGNAEEESDFDIQENYDRLDEIVVEKRPFVHIEGLDEEEGEDEIDDDLFDNDDEIAKILKGGKEIFDALGGDENNEEEDEEAK